MFSCGMDITAAAHLLNTTLNGYSGFWCVAGGWAIDLYLNRQTRVHEDLEIVVLRNDYEILFQQFNAHKPQKIICAEPPQYIQWQGEPLEPEVIQLRLGSMQSSDFDLLLTPSEGGEWICRRDESIRLPFSEAAVMSKMGVPVLAPQIVLLFKAKYMREKDRQDYANVIEALDMNGRVWLTASLNKVHPGHPWTAVSLPGKQEICT